MKNNFVKNKRGMTADMVIKIILWVIFTAVIFMGIKYLLQKTGVW